MTRLTAVAPETATGKLQELFTAVEGKLGMVPNMMRTMGQSTALLEGYLNLSAALGKGSLGAATGTLLAIAVAEANQCGYCLAAHTYIGDKLVHINPPALDNARDGQSADAKTQAALRFAQTLVTKQGLVNDADVALVKAAGHTEGEVAEIVGHVAMNILTNYFNNTANTVVDFPEVKLMSVE
jgi:uncharacterized peroxidase-related enzyme